MKILLAASLISLVYGQIVTVDLSNYHQVEYDTPVEVVVGEQLQVLLRENPTTGYIWQTP